MIDLDARHGPFVGVLDADDIAAYALATNDPNPRYLEGECVPPAFIVTRTFAAQEAATATIPREVFDAARTGVHGAHDIDIARPLIVGEELTTWSSLEGVRTSSAGTGVTLRIESADAAGAAVIVQRWTILFVGAAGFPDQGDAAPDHSLTDDTRARRAATAVRHVDVDQATRYAEVAGDWSAHHFDDDVARAGGFPGVFIHGLCTLGIASGAVIDAVAGSDPSRVRRLATRFSAPTHPDTDLEVAVFDGGLASTGARLVGFEAVSRGSVVLKHGRLELA